MTDTSLMTMWIGVLAAGVVGVVALRAAGWASTYVRDLLHIGAGVWIVGWPSWRGAAAPVSLVVGVAIATALVPALARRSRWVARFQRSVADGDERFGGLVWYTLSYAVLTAVGLCGEAFPAAAALLSLSLGDGVGGAVGRRFGRHHYLALHGKQKSVEGSAAVFVFATAGVLAAAVMTGADAHLARATALGATAAVAEGIAPRGTDNVVVPAAVFAAAYLVA